MITKDVRCITAQRTGDIAGANWQAEPPLEENDGFRM
jgi:hypothetical protein